MITTDNKKTAAYEVKNVEGLSQTSCDDIYESGLQKLDQKKQNHQTLKGRTKPFLFSGKCLDFIGTMFTLIVFMSAIGQTIFNLFAHNYLIIGILLMLSMLSIILLLLVGFYLYHGITGLPVHLDKDQSTQFPPARLKIKDVIIIAITLSVNLAVLIEGFTLAQQDTFNSFDLFQSSLAVIAFIFVLSGLFQLYKEHQIWKSAH
ncbi:hypothetical protein [Acinetobacter indicus]|uniref:hypothetical protein n=1 Tax=Acinetobacter indicus TaxID=756892 RepID=UPI00398A1A3A